MDCNVTIPGLVAMLLLQELSEFHSHSPKENSKDGSVYKVFPSNRSKL